MASLRFSRLAVAVAAATLSHVAAAEQRHFDIPAGLAQDAIPEFARQANLQVLAPGGVAGNVRLSAVQGDLETRSALNKLLEGSGLRVQSDSGSVITLTASSEASTVDRSANGGRPSGSATGQEATESEDEPQREEVPLPSATLPAEADERVLNEVYVVGSFLRGTSAAEPALPVTVIDRQDVALSGVSTTSELLAQLPQAAEFDNSETATGPNDARGDAASVNLRGLGSGNTLVLLNGRRIAPHPISAGEVPRLSTNINQIPLGAIDSIEVLRDGASALYGSDAVSGVINANTRRRFTGVEATVRYGDVADGSIDETSGSLAFGQEFNDGRSSFNAFVSLFDRGSLTGAERNLTADLRARAGSDAAAWDNTSTSGPFGQFTTGRANADGSFTTRPIPGGPSNGRFVTAPTAGGVGVLNGALPGELRYDFAPDFDLIPETERLQIFSGFQDDFDDMTAYVDALFYSADSSIANAAVPISSNSDNNVFVPASNYYNPFGTRFYGPGTSNPNTAPLDVLIRNYRPVEIGFRVGEVESRSYQITGGLRGYWDAWAWDVGGATGEGRTTDTGLNMISESRLRQQLALSTPDAFNVFGGPGANSEAVLDAVRISTTRRGVAGLDLLDAKVNGPLFALPAGDVLAAFGVEYRRETFDDRRDVLSNADDVIAQSQSSDSSGSRNIRSAFAEFSVPLVGEDNAFAGVRSLDLSLSARSEHYSDFGSTTNPKLALVWSPIKGVLFRASYNEGFRAPTLAQVFVGEIVRRSTGQPDRYRSDVTNSPVDLGTESRQIVRGGNLDLGPEESKANSVGFVFDVPFVESLSLTVDYFRIRQNDVIDTFGEADQLALDFLLRTTGQGFNANVVRLPVTPEGQALFDAYNAANPNAPRAAVGEIDFVRDTFINISSREVAGIDWGLVYRIPESRFGQFTLRTDVARLNRFQQRRDSTSPLTDSIGVNGLPRDRAVASISWKRKNLDAGLRANHVTSFFDTSAPALPDGSDFEVASFTTFNAYVGAHLFENSAIVDDLYFKIGVNNVFDREPPLADESRGFDEDIHDPRGRFLYAEVRARW